MSPRDPPARGLTRGAWRAQKAAAKRRGIEFRFPYKEWLTWWQEALAQRCRGAERGQGLGKYAMCRFGDRGPYEVGNVYCGTERENQAERRPEARRSGKPWLGRTGPDHPMSRPVATRDGAFPSVRAAAAHYGVSRTEFRRRLADGRLSMPTTNGSV